MRHIALLDMDRPTYHVDFPWQPQCGSEPYDWLETTPGNGFSFGGHGIYFYREEDAIMFTLKWAGQCHT